MLQMRVGDGCATPTSCTNVSPGMIREANVVRSSASPRTATAPRASFRSEPSRTTARTV
jgi:hypothetical protein